MNDDEATTATLILVSKYPYPGVSKTRLAASIGEANAATIAHACLQDLLSNIGNAAFTFNIRRWLLFAPPEAVDDMALLVQDCGVRERWSLVPISATNNLKSSNLSAILSDALSKAQATRPGPIVFLGMDTPQLNMSEIEYAVEAANKGDAYICQAEDGGFILLGVPKNCPPSVFESVHWSSDDTYSTQVNAIKAHGISCTKGTTYFDIDDVSDVKRLLAVTPSLESHCIRTMTAAKRHQE